MQNNADADHNVVGLISPNDRHFEEEGQNDIIPLLQSISKYTRSILQIRLAELGLQNGQDELLLALEKSSASTISGLADQVNVRGSTMSKMVDHLAGRGLVARSIDTVDTRRVYVRLTPRGQDMRHRLRALRVEIERDLVHSLSQDEIQRMRAELWTAERQLQKRLRRIR